jgi:hypothetical protein
LGFVDVDWTGDASGTFNLIWDDINTSWNNSALVTDGNGHYSVEVTTCNALMSFVVSTQLGTCLNVSNVAEGVFNDQTPPAVPVVRSVGPQAHQPIQKVIFCTVVPVGPWRLLKHYLFLQLPISMLMSTVQHNQDVTCWQRLMVVPMEILLLPIPV